MRRTHSVESICPHAHAAVENADERFVCQFQKHDSFCCFCIQYQGGREGGYSLAITHKKHPCAAAKEYKTPVDQCNLNRLSVRSVCLTAWRV